MKIQILNTEGKKQKEIETNIFDSKIRRDIIQKVVEQEKSKQPHAPFYLAGKQASASGKVRHRRRKWKTVTGRGLSRIPRKIFWRRGTQFHWEGATVASTKGGRRAHPPKILSMINLGKINKKEKQFALLSALALTASLKDVQKKYKSLEDKTLQIHLPLLVDNKILELKLKPLFLALNKILNEFSSVAIQKKAVRAGRGKSRGRKYKKTSGLLFVVGEKEGGDKNIQGIEIRKASSLSVTDLASNGARLTLYTEEAIKELENRFSKSKKEEKPKKKESKKKENKINKRKKSNKKKIKKPSKTEKSKEKKKW